MYKSKIKYGEGKGLLGIGPDVRQNFYVSNDVNRYVIELLLRLPFTFTLLFALPV